jgi:hypothetical protein
MLVSVFVLPKRLSLLAIVVLSGSSIRDCKEILVEFRYSNTFARTWEIVKPQPRASLAIN